MVPLWTAYLSSLIYLHIYLSQNSPSCRFHGQRSADVSTIAAAHLRLTSQLSNLDREMQSILIVCFSIFVTFAIVIRQASTDFRQKENTLAVHVEALPIATEIREYIAREIGVQMENIIKHTFYRPYERALFIFHFKQNEKPDLVL